MELVGIFTIILCIALFAGFFFIFYLSDED